VDGHPVCAEELVYWALHKPRGILCTNHDPSGRPLVADILPHVPQRVYTVGRLDADSEGLLLMTNDGPMALRLTHPRYEVQKTYRVQVAGNPGEKDLEKLLEGVYLSEGRVRAKTVERLKSQGESTWLKVVLAEGKNREIRRMLAQLGHKVLRLVRLAIGPLLLDRLPAGKSRRLSLDEINRLRRLCKAVQARREALVEGGVMVDIDSMEDDTSGPEARSEAKAPPRSAQAGPRTDRPETDRRGPGGPPRGGDRPFRAGPGGPPRGGDRPFRAGPGGPPRGGDRPFRAGPGGPPRGGDRPFGAGIGGPPRDEAGSDRPRNPGPDSAPRRAPGERPFREGSDIPANQGIIRGSTGPTRPPRPPMNRQEGDRPYRDGPSGAPRGGPGGDRPYRDGPGGPPRGGPGADRPYRAGPGGPPRGGPGGDRPFRAGPGGPPRGGPGADRPYRDGPSGPPRGGPGGDRPFRAGPGGLPRGGPGGDRPYRAGPGGPPRGGPGGDRPYRAGPGGPPRGGPGGDRPYRAGGPPQGRMVDGRPFLAGRDGALRSGAPSRPASRPGSLQFTPGNPPPPRPTGPIPKAKTPLRSGYRPPVRPARKPAWRKKPGEAQE